MPTPATASGLSQHKHPFGTLVDGTPIDRYT